MPAPTASYLACTFIAVVALMVAAIGITNTMLMSVLERTHEIGETAT